VGGTPSYYESIVIDELQYHHRLFREGMCIPFVSYDPEVEYEHRKKMTKAFALVLEYYGVTLEAKQRKAKRKNLPTMGSKEDSGTLP